MLAPQSSLVVEVGADVMLGLTLPTTVKPTNVMWDNGETGDTLHITDIRESQEHTARFTLAGEEVEIHFKVLVYSDESSMIEPGRYLLRHIATDTYLTAIGKNQLATFQPRSEADETQTWLLERNTSGKYNMISLASTDSLKLNTNSMTTSSTYYPFYIEQAIGTDLVALSTGTKTTRRYWNATDDGTVNTSFSTTLQLFPFQLISLDETGIQTMENVKDKKTDAIYDLSGRRVEREFNMLLSQSRKGIYITNGIKIIP